MHCAPLFGDDGQVDRVVASFTDITDRVKHEQEIERVQTIVQAVGDAVYTLDEEGVFTFVNDAFEELTGHDRDDLVGEHCSVVMSDEDIEAGEAIIRDLLEGDDEAGITEMSGENWADHVESVEVHIALLPFDVEFQGTVGVVRDVTERKRRERKLRESEEKYATVVEEANDGVIIAQDERLQFANSRAAEILDADPESVEGTPIADVVAPNHRETVVERFERRIEGEGVEKRYEFDALSVTGERVPIEFTPSTITYEGEPAVLAVCRDVSDRRQHDRERRQYETIVETAPDGVFIVDEAANYVSGNAQVASLTGYSQSELESMSVPDMVADGVFDPEVIPRYEETVSGLLSTTGDARTSSSSTRTRRTPTSPASWSATSRSGRSTRSSGAPSACSVTSPSATAASGNWRPATNGSTSSRASSATTSGARSTSPPGGSTSTDSTRRNRRSTASRARSTAWTRFSRNCSRSPATARTAARRRRCRCRSRPSPHGTLSTRARPTSASTWRT